MYGTQALEAICRECGLFENDVNMYGTQAEPQHRVRLFLFENDVNMYGTQAAFANVMERF